MSRSDDSTDHKATLSAGHGATPEETSRTPREERICTVEALRATKQTALHAATPSGRKEWEDADESRRTRLIADLTRLIREPSTPEGTRVAGLSLIGWLARRRPEEAPHAIGIDEARESERRLKTVRPKAR
ncbi:MAG: hypothetical protein M3O50_07165 [Myxococcota bacterium]|nr:hypothetical protein [Myxococcota bacterium]